MSNAAAKTVTISSEEYSVTTSKLEGAKLNTSRALNTVQNARDFLSGVTMQGFHTDGFSAPEVLESLLCAASCLLRETYLAMVAGDDHPDEPPKIL